MAVRSEGLNMKDNGNTDISKTFFFAFFGRKLCLMFSCVLYIVVLWHSSQFGWLMLSFYCTATQIYTE